jgi:hypothetical protein
MSGDLWNGRQAPDGVYIALRFLGRTNPPTPAKVQGLLKLSGQRRHAFAKKHPLWRLLFFLLLYMYYTAKRQV